MTQMPSMAAQAKAQRRANIPNLLSLARVLLALIFVVLISLAEPRTLSTDGTVGSRVGELSQTSTTLIIIAAGLFIVAAITDAVDGHLARKWNAESKFGRIMDPFADKVLVLGGFVLLAGPTFSATLPSGEAMQITAVSGWMVVLMIARELLVTSIRGVFEGEGVEFGAGNDGQGEDDPPVGVRARDPRAHRVRIARPRERGADDHYPAGLGDRCRDRALGPAVHREGDQTHRGSAGEDARGDAREEAAETDEDHRRPGRQTAEEVAPGGQGGTRKR